MSHIVEAKQQSPQPTLVVRTRTSVDALPQAMGQAFGAIAQYLAELGEMPAGAPFAAYHNMDMQDLDVEIGFPVASPLAGRGEILAGEIPGGMIASCLHTGPYPELRAAYDAMGQWIADNGYEPTGVAYEMYLNDPTEVSAQELQTLVLFPLKASGRDS